MELNKIIEKKQCGKCESVKYIKDFSSEVRRGKVIFRKNCKRCELDRCRIYREKNREIMKLRDRIRYESMSGAIKSEYIKKKAKQNALRNSTSNSLKKYRKSDKAIFLRYINDSNRRNRSYEFSLKYEEFCNLIKAPCYYCGATLSRGVDRVDNSKGYIIENCVSCCEVCNRMKHILSYDGFLSHIEAIYRFRVAIIDGSPTVLVK